MSLFITLALMGITAFVAFETGRRFERGVKERFRNDLEVEKERRGRRGTVRLRSMKINR